MVLWKQAGCKKGLYTSKDNSFIIIGSTFKQQKQYLFERKLKILFCIGFVKLKPIPICVPKHFTSISLKFACIQNPPNLPPGPIKVIQVHQGGPKLKARYFKSYTFVIS